VCYGLDVVVAGRYPDVWGRHRSFVYLEEGGGCAEGIVP